MAQKNIHPIVSSYMADIGSIGGKRGSHADKVKAGQVKSRKKAAASRANGKLGGRPVVDVDDKLAIKK